MTDSTQSRAMPRRWLRRALWAGAAMAAAPSALAALLLVWGTTRWEPAAFDLGAAQGLAYAPFEPLVPGPAAHPGVPAMSANNNVDMAVFEGRTYIAYRTAPTHFASRETRIAVVSSADQAAWQPEAAFYLGADLREPRFLVYGGKLLLYFFRGGTDPLAFEPDCIHATERRGPGAWAEPVRIFEPGYVVWRARAHNGLAYMSVYNGAGIYTTAERPGEVRLLTSTDGYDWSPISERPQVSDPGAEEGEFIFDDAGNLIAVVRLEVQGAKVCFAPKEDLGAWDCTYTPYKYDSSLLFRHGGETYLVARRNVAGAFHRGMHWLPDRVERLWYLLRYSITRKRTAVYRVDVASRSVAPLIDLPSRGDTAFAGMAPLDARSYALVNYSSPIDGPDLPWIGGQLIGTTLYRTVLTLPPA